MSKTSNKVLNPNSSSFFTPFKANLDAVYEAERFYGDETLEALCLHAKEVTNDIDMFSEIVEIFEMEYYDEEITEEGEEGGEEENPQKEI